MFSADMQRTASNGSPDRVDALVWGLTEIFDKITGRRLTKEEDPDYNNGNIKPNYQVPDWASNNPNGWMGI